MTAELHLSNIPGQDALRWLRALAVYIFLVAVFLLYGHTYFYDDPTGMFFDESRAYVPRYSDHRIEELQDWVDDEVVKDPYAFPKAASRPAVCAAIMSVARAETDYLPIVVESAVHGFAPCERRDLYLDVLVAHTDPQSHPFYRNQLLVNLTDSTHGYNLTRADLSTIASLEAISDYRTKGVQDYIHALRSCYATSAPHIIVFEDDIVLADGWFAKTQRALHHITSHLHVNPSTWLFMRLFNQERSTGWGSRHVGGNHEFPISLGITLVTISIILLLRKRSTFCRQHLDNALVTVLCLLAIPTFVVLFYKAGKASMLPPSPGVRKEFFGCCSQAMVFPRGQVPRIIEWLEQEHSGQIDLFLDALAEHDKLDRWALYPVQAQHIGRKSVRGTTAEESQAIWSMAFERLDPGKLRREHEADVRAFYGEECSAELQTLEKHR